MSPFFVFLEKRLIVNGPMYVKFSLNINLFVSIEDHLSLNFKIYSNKMNLKVVLCCHADIQNAEYFYAVNKQALLAPSWTPGTRTSHICVVSHEKHLQSPQNG